MRVIKSSARCHCFPSHCEEVKRCEEEVWRGGVKVRKGVRRWWRALSYRGNHGAIARGIRVQADGGDLAEVV